MSLDQPDARYQSPFYTTRRRFLERTTGMAAASAVSTSWIPRVSAAAESGSKRAAGDSIGCSKLQAPMRDVHGKTAFITGGDSGVGLGIARAFANAGMRIVITYRTKRHLDEAMGLLQKTGAEIHSISLDVTERGAMLAAAAETIKIFGKVHVFVNNAGVDAGGMPLAETTFEDWDWVTGVNINGVFIGLHAFLPFIMQKEADTLYRPLQFKG